MVEIHSATAFTIGAQQVSLLPAVLRTARPKANPAHTLLFYPGCPMQSIVSLLKVAIRYCCTLDLQLRPIVIGSPMQWLSFVVKGTQLINPQQSGSLTESNIQRAVAEQITESSGCPMQPILVVVKGTQRMDL